MKLLLDTCTFLWLIAGDSQLSREMQKVIVDPAHDVFLSVISVWEVIVKQRLGKLNLPPPPGDYIQKQRERHEITSLPLDEASVSHLIKLPSFHRDPFDRMLICQAMEHGLPIITPDPAITAYPIKTFWK